MLKIAFKWFKNLFPPFLGFFLIYYSYSNTTIDDRKTIYSSIIDANYFFVILSICLGFFSHFIRALRWKNMLSPMGYEIKFHKIKYDERSGVSKLGFKDFFKFIYTIFSLLFYYKPFKIILPLLR